MTKFLTFKNALIAIAVLPALMVIFAIVGGFLNYSPVPFFDSWDGVYRMYMHLQTGDMSPLWGQHNEHRIFFARLLFIIDLKLFGGTQVFLIGVNYILVGISVYLFRHIFNECLKGILNKVTLNVVTVFVAGWLCLWVQEENLTWAFQSQFFLAQIIPLAAFFMLYKAINAPLKSKEFLTVCALGVAAAGTMANGVLALPLLTLGACLLGFNKKHIAALAGLTLIVLLAYFKDYHAVQGHGSLTETLLNHPIGVLYYAAVYVGSPFRFGIENPSDALSISAIFGVILIFQSAIKATTTLPHRKENTLQICLLLFILYIGGTALSTAGGRLALGEATALASRYSTPALMAWLALLCLYIHDLIKFFGKYKFGILTGLSCLTLVSIWAFSHQMEALENKTGLRTHKAVALIAAELSINDAAVLKFIYPHPPSILELSKAANDKNLGVFNLPYIKGLREEIGKPAKPVATQKCLGAMDRFEFIAEGTDYVRVHGWIFDQEQKSTPKFLEFTDSKGNIVGYANTGLYRSDLENLIHPKAKNAGFIGYVLTSAKNDILTLNQRHLKPHKKNIKPVCSIQNSFPES